MPTRNELLEKTKELVQLARDLSAEKVDVSNPFSQVSGTPHLDGLKLNGAVISDADLAKLLGDIEKAKSNDDTWKKIAGTVGSLIGSLAKGVIFICLFALIGCGGTPPPIQQASSIEADAMRTFKADHDAIVAAYHSDLALSLETQVRLIEDYEIKSKGSAMDQAALTTLLTQARAKREEIAARLAIISANVKTADKNFEITMKMHGAIDEFLRRPGFEIGDVTNLLGDIMGLKEQLIPTK
jgi:hypothetical protein